MNLRVQKFGGTSLGTGAALAGAVARSVLASREGALVVVVSAFAGVTDDLEAALTRAEERDGRYRRTISALRERSASLLKAVAAGPEALRAEARCGDLLQRLRELLDAVALLRHCPDELRDEAMAVGERLAAVVFAAGLTCSGRPADVVDAAEFVRTDSTFGQGTIDRERTEAATRARLGGRRLTVVPGFFGADERGRTVLLGRGGSDTSATLVGAALRADKIEIFTDVDGVLTADPRLVPEARTLLELGYEDAATAAALGAKVLHVRAVGPAAAARVPIVVRNSFGTGAASLIREGRTPSGFVITATREVDAAWRAASRGPLENGPPGNRDATARGADLVAVAALGPAAHGRGLDLLAALAEARIEVGAFAASAPGLPFLACVAGVDTAPAVTVLHALLHRASGRRRPEPSVLAEAVG